MRENIIHKIVQKEPQGMQILITKINYSVADVNSRIGSEVGENI